jgi:mRNA-degrading endonuclease RelE of RelBE toxin-antitoxin system
MRMKYSDVVRLPEFVRDLKKLKKRYRTIEEDLDTFINTAIRLHDAENDMGIVRISGLGIENPPVYKGRKFACRSLKGKGARSGIRVVFAHFEAEERIELVEIYVKSDQANHDVQRILEHYGE